MDTKTKDQYLVQIGALKDTMLTMRNQMEVLIDMVNRTPTIELAGFEELTADESAILTVMALVKKGCTVKRHPDFGLCYSSDQIHWQQLVMVDAVAQTPTGESEFLKYFIGPKGMFTEVLHSEVIEGGTGILRPNVQDMFAVANLPQFADDITTVLVEKLVNYDTGFYRNRSTKNLQFFVKAGGIMVILDMLPTPAEPIIVMIGQSGPVRVPLQMLDLAMFGTIQVLLQSELELLQRKHSVS